MGLADVNAAVTGGTGVLFSNAESAFDAYNTAFLVSPDLGLVEKLIREKQTQLHLGITFNRKIET